MAEAVVNVVVEQLILATTEWLTEEISLITGVEDELENMSTKMRTIQDVLDDAENQSMKRKIVKQRLEDLQDLAYDMEDVMDEWNTIVQKQKLEDASTHEISSSSSSKSTCLSFKQFNCFGTSIKQVSWRRDIAIRIKDINKRMNIIFGQIENLKLIAKVLGNTHVMAEPFSTIDRTTTSSIQESQIHGRDGDKKYLLNKVLSQSSGEHNNAHVISILGAGGLGKTTLAQLVYNHENVKGQFDFRIWVCVSDPFDEFKVAQGILEGLAVDHRQMTHLQTLHESIKKKLSKKKFLLVLDDVWDDDSKKWDRLQVCLEFGASESRIIVTTRKEEVAKLMSLSPTNIYRPSFISTSDCWKLMSQAAFRGKGEEDCRRLEDIGKKIAKKCKGLPLAAKVLGGLLRSKDTLEQWTEVLNSEIWKLEKAEIEIFPHLFLSYKQLSSGLKRCFSFCSLFPKDHEIDREELISFWMAQTQIDSRIIKDHKMVTGQRYIELLKSSAFLEDVGFWTDKVKLHDVMHDFALHLSGHEFLSIMKTEKSDSSEGQEYAQNMKTRHLFFHGTKNPTSFCDVGKLRTCYVRGVPRNVTLDLLKQLKLVRALYLLDCDLEEIPEEIGKLIHLRTLDLRNNINLHSLPETIGELYNLEYLWLRKVIDTSFMLPKSLGKLINLQGLRPFSVENENSNLGMLKNLNKLGGAFKIVFTSSYDDEDDAKAAKLASKKHITELSFNFRYKEVTNDVFEALEAPPGVQILHIRNFYGERILPNWFTSLSYLKELKLSNAPNTLSIPPLGKLPSLETLIIQYFSVLKLIGREFLGIEDNNQCSFPKLLRFKLSYCPILEEWEGIKAEDEDTITVMPILKCLEISACHKLVLPNRLICKAASLQELSSDLGFIDPFYDEQHLLNLRVLNISYFKGGSLPNCILSLNQLTKLHIKHSGSLEYLPALGKLPCLEDLFLYNLSSLRSIGPEFLGMEHNNKDIHVLFPKLVKFHILFCEVLKEWEDIEGEEVDTITIMPQLQNLLITGCRSLKALPSRLLCKAPRLNMLKITGCRRLLEKSIREDQQLMLHILTMHFHNNTDGSSDDEE